MKDKDGAMDLSLLKARLEAEIPANFLYEHDSSDHPAFELDVVPLIAVELGRLDALDLRRRSVDPDTTYLFGQHAREVAQDLEAVARALGAEERVATALHYLALVHDVGKRFLPFEIWGTQEKPSKAFKALRRAHGALGAAYLSGDPALVEAHADPEVLPLLKGQKPLDDIVPREIRGKIAWSPAHWQKIAEEIAASPFKGFQTSFLPMAVAAALRHHDYTGRRAPEGQPLWLKLLALMEDLSGNMTERPHFASQDRGTTLEEALAHMREEGPEIHALDLLALIGSVKGAEPPASLPGKQATNDRTREPG